MATDIVFTFRDSALDELVERSQRLARTGPPLKLDSTNRSIQFLRGVFSRASLCLPAFYYFLGAASSDEEAKASKDYSFKVAHSYSRFSDLNTITLSCRKIFDHAIRIDLTGANFAKVTNESLKKHAEHWADRSSRSIKEALIALNFLQQFFKKCSKNDTILLREDSQLQRRVGLLKQHADRAAAHLSLDDYAISIKDLIHFVGAIVIIGEIIRSFDSPGLGVNYFSELDSASYKAAQKIFPQIPKFQLFGNINIEMQARLYWECAGFEGIQMLLNELHHSLGGEPK